MKLLSRKIFKPENIFSVMLTIIIVIMVAWAYKLGIVKGSGLMLVLPLIIIPFLVLLSFELYGIIVKKRLSPFNDFMFEREDKNRAYCFSCEKPDTTPEYMVKLMAYFLLTGAFYVSFGVMAIVNFIIFLSLLTLKYKINPEIFYWLFFSGWAIYFAFKDEEIKRIKYSFLSLCLKTAIILWIFISLCFQENMRIGNDYFFYDKKSGKLFTSLGFTPFGAQIFDQERFYRTEKTKSFPVDLEVVVKNKKSNWKAEANEGDIFRKKVKILLTPLTYRAYGAIRKKSPTEIKIQVDRQESIKAVMVQNLEKYFSLEKGEIFLKIEEMEE